VVLFPPEVRRGPEDRIKGREAGFAFLWEELFMIVPSFSRPSWLCEYLTRISFSGTFPRFSLAGGIIAWLAHRPSLPALRRPRPPHGLPKGHTLPSVCRDLKPRFSSSRHSLRSTLFTPPLWSPFQALVAISVFFRADLPHIPPLPFFFLQVASNNTGSISVSSDSRL